MTDTQLRYLSVCSGIEAATVAWHPLGWEPVAFSEIEPFPCAVLAHRWPDVPNLGDMCELPAMIRAGFIDAPDILVGGTPCQAFSVAGMRRGLADPRGQLTIKFVEIADAIDEQRETPCTVLWENVPGVLSSKDNAFGCFLASLVGEECPLEPAGGKWSNAGCVYGPQRSAAWRVFDAQYFGVAQRRRRVFVVASADPRVDPAKILFESEGVRRDSPPCRKTGASVAALTANGVGTCGADDNQGQAGHLLAWGGNNTGGPIEVATACNAHGGASGRMDFETETFITVGVLGQQSHSLTAEGHNASEDGTGRGTPVIAFSCKDSGADTSADVAPTPLSVRRLMPVECERLQGMPDGHTAIPGAADGPRYKAIGNSKAVPVIRWLGRRMERVLCSL